LELPKEGNPVVQTADRKFNEEELLHALSTSIECFPFAKSFEQQAYFEGTYPLESISDPEALRKRFNDIEGRLLTNVGEPVICIRDGDVVLLYMGIINRPEVIFQFDQNSLLPRGSASIEVGQFEIAAITFNDQGGADVEVIQTSQTGAETYFHFEERGFKELGEEPEKYECASTNWDLLIGNDEIEKFFGQARLILPIRQGLATVSELGAIEVTATEIQNPRSLDR